MKKTIYTDECRALLSWLKNERKRQGFTLRRLAAKLGFHHSILGRIEQGERRLDIVEFTRLCNAIGCRPEQGMKLIISQMTSSGAVPYSDHSTRKIKEVTKIRAPYHSKPHIRNRK